MTKTILLGLLCTLPLSSYAEQEQAFRNPELPLEARLDDLMAQLSLTEKISLLGETAPAIERLGIEGYNHGNEALHGVVRPGNFTVYPRPLGLAATFNPEGIEVMADQISTESRARYNELEHKSVGGKFGGRYNGLLTFWSPTVNMARDPRWGRTGETYGEDPHLTATLGAAFVKGLQGEGPILKAIATPKHYVANNQETDRFSYKAVIPMRSLREYYLKGFEGCIREGKAYSLMSAYNAVNGIPCSVNSLLLNDILRDEWGFKGYVVGDLYSPLYVFNRHGYTKSMEETAALCLKSGLDLDSGFAPFAHIENAIKQGLCSESDVDRSVRRVLSGRFKLGMFDPEDKVPYNQLGPEVIGAAAHQAHSLKLAEQSMVLLKNTGILPLGDNIKKIAVLGTCIDTYKHQQYSVEEESANPAITPRIALRAACQAKGIELLEINQQQLEEQQNFTMMNTHAFPQGLQASYESDVIQKAGLDKNRSETQINIDREGQAPNSYHIGSPLKASWSGTLVAPLSGTYRFRLSFNGDISGSIGSAEIKAMQENGENQAQELSLSLQKGESADIKIHYTDKQGNALCRLEWICPSPNDREATLQSLKDCDAIIMPMGLSSLRTGEGEDKFNLDLPAEQSKLIKDVHAVNPKIVLILMNSTPLALNWEDANIPAIIEAWYPGEQGGTALVRHLWGETSPSGRLPISFPKSLDDIPPFDSYDITAGRTYMYNSKAPLYPFGHGLSYTQFHYSDIQTDKKVYSDKETIQIQFTLSNTGAYDGDEIVQLYFKPRKVDTDIALPQKQLKGYKRVSLAQGESQCVRFSLPASELHYFDEADKCFKTYHGQIELQVGASSQDIKTNTTLELK